MNLLVLLFITISYSEIKNVKTLNSNGDIALEIIISISITIFVISLKYLQKVETTKQCRNFMLLELLVSHWEMLKIIAVKLRIIYGQKNKRISGICPTADRLRDS